MPKFNLGTYTPNEVLNGAVPDFSKFKEPFDAAKKKKIVETQAAMITALNKEIANLKNELSVLKNKKNSS